MTYKKIVCSGSIIEVYEFEKDPKTIEKNRKEKKHNQYEELILELNGKAWIHETSGERVDERRKQTIREARNTARRLALMNFSEGDTFITLTYPNDRHLTENDIAIADNDFKKFMQRFKYKYGKIKYLAVREFTKRGRIHFHMVTDWRPGNALTENQIKEIEREVGQNIWKHGFVDIKVMSGIDNIGAYLIKYMTKNVSAEAFKGHKIYLCSKGLERPVVMRGDEAEAVLNAYKLKNKKEVFTNSYESEYLGKINYKEYNLKRL